MTQVVCLFVVMGWALLRSDDQGLLMTVVRWFFFGFLVPLLVLVLLEPVLFDPRDEYIEQMCLHDVHFATYELCAEDAGRYYDANPDEFEE